MNIAPSESLLRSMIDAMPDGVVIIDDLHVAYANPAAVTICGAASVDDIVGRSIVRFVEPSSTDAMVAMTRAFIAGENQTAATTIDFHRLDGQTLSAELSARRVPGLAATAVMVIIKDVTERDRLSRDLVDAMERGRFLAENAVDVLIRAHPTLGIGYSSPASTEVLGIEPADMVGRQLIELFAPVDRPTVSTALAEVASMGAGRPAVVEVRSAAQVGRPSRWVEAAIRPVTGAVDGQVELHVTISDITRRREVAAELSKAEARQRMILDGLQEGVILHTLGTTEFVANPVARDVLGIEAHASAATGRNSLEGMFFEPAGVVLDARDSPLARAHRTRKPQIGRVLRFERDGESPRWLEFDAIPMHDLNGEPAVLVTFRDITAQWIAQAHLAESAQVLASVLNAATNEAIIVTDSHARIVAFSRGAEARFGYKAADVIGKLAIAELHDEADITAYAASQGLTVAELVVRQPPADAASNLDSVMRRSDGSTFLGSMSISTRLDKSGQSLGFLYVLNDVTERRQQEADLHDRVARDHLTGLLNRRALETQLAQVAQDDSWSHPGRLLMFIDLDHFKEVNDAAGHQVGDEVLVQAVERIRGALRSADLVYRYGGDEFVVLFEQAVTLATARAAAERIVSELAVPFMFAGGVSQIGASVGIAGSSASVGPDQLIHDADAAVYVAKRNGRGRVVCVG